MSAISSSAASEYSTEDTLPFDTKHAQFSRSVRKSLPVEQMSIIQRNSTMMEVCGHETYPSFLGTSEFFYDSRAVYENPLITATSRTLISDIHALTHLCCAVDVPRPVSVLRTVLRVRPPNQPHGDPWFKAIRIWTEVNDLSEMESFDGHKKRLVEYTLNVLFFPDLHTTYKMPKTLMLRRPPSSASVDSQLSLSVPSSPYLPIPGTLITLPSPLHFQFSVITQLIFNEQDQITYHRDIWDVRDVIRLIPGIRMILWFMGRVGAWGLGWISRKVCSHTDNLVVPHTRT